LLGNTALHHAVMLGSAEATKILLKDVRLDNCNNSGSTPLHIAANAGSIETLTVLLEAMLPEFDIDIPDKVSYITCCRLRIIFHMRQNYIDRIVYYFYPFRMIIRLFIERLIRVIVSAYKL
jgi:hypothetical protein